MAENLHRFGEVAVDLEMITEDDLKSALEFQREAASHHLLGDIFLLQGILQAKQVKRILQAQEARRLFASKNGYDTAANLSVGERIDEFKILAVFGEPGKQRYLVDDLEQSKQAVLSFCNAPDNPTKLERFLRIHRADLQWDHPHLLTAYKVKQVDLDCAYSVREYIEGRSLYHLLNSDDQLTQEQAVKIIQDIGQALQFIHSQNRLHQTLSPHEIIVGSRLEAILIHDHSFEFFDSLKLNSDGTFLGSTDYMAPEIGRCQELDARLDLYSLGLVFYHCLTGAAPFHSQTVMSILAGRAHDEIPPPERHSASCPEALQRILSCMLMKDRERRYSSINDFLDDLASYQCQRPIHAGPSELWVETTPRKVSSTKAIGGIGRALWLLWTSLRRI